jgi:hypothetical protein
MLIKRMKRISRFFELEKIEFKFINWFFQNFSVLIGAPRYESQLYNKAERSGAIFHCEWKESDSISQVVCDQIDLRRGIYNKFLHFRSFFFLFVRITWMKSYNTM